MSVTDITSIVEDGVDFGDVVRYTETETKTGRWVHRGTVERVRWRAVPASAEYPINYYNRKRDAIAYLHECGGVSDL